MEIVFLVTAIHAWGVKKIENAKHTHTHTLQVHNTHTHTQLIRCGEIGKSFPTFVDPMAEVEIVGMRLWDKGWNAKQSTITTFNKAKVKKKMSKTCF